METGSRGYALITAIIAINIFAIFSMMAASMWQREIGRENESELIFRGNQYVRAIQEFRKKHPNTYPRNLDILEEEKCIRRLYKDPVSETGEWNYVIKSRNANNKALIIITPDLLAKYGKSYHFIGVASSSPEQSYREYRGKNRYDEWAFYFGQKTDQEMPALKFVNN